MKLMKERKKNYRTTKTVVIAKDEAEVLDQEIYREIQEGFSR